MQVQIDINVLEKHQITPDEFIYLYKLYIGYKDKILLRINKNDLMDKGFLRRAIGLEIITLSEKSIELLEALYPSRYEDPKDWIDKWRDLFPNIKSGGYRVRSDKHGCLDKMNKFFKKYPEYTKDIVFRATKKYIEEKKKDNYAYISLAHYFIEKTKQSQLAAYCELVNDKEEDIDVNPFSIDI